MSISPKSAALPVEAIVIKSISFLSLGVAPPAKVPLVEFYIPASAHLATVRSPKSCALPVEAMVT